MKNLESKLPKGFKKTEENGIPYYKINPVRQAYNYIKDCIRGNKQYKSPFPNDDSY